MSKLSDNLSTLRSVLHSHARRDGTLHLPAAQTNDLLTFLSASVGMAKALELQAEMASAAARRLPDPVMLPGTNVVPFAPRHRPQPSTGGDAA
jgi:hypothetical protein